MDFEKDYYFIPKKSHKISIFFQYLMLNFDRDYHKAKQILYLRVLLYLNIQYFKDYFKNTFNLISYRKIK